jgi:hypothetical protein
MRSRKVSARTADRLKDEVYRQMLRLEAGHSAAVPLALALLNAWTVCDGQLTNCELRLWLRRVCPVCMRMMTEALDCRRIGSDPQDRC